MGYSKQIYQKAKQQLAERRQRAFEIADRHKQEIYTRLPRVRELDKQLAATGTEVIKAVSSHAEDLTEIMNDLMEQSLALQEERKNLLAASGYPAAYTEPAYTCSVCQDSGYYNNQRCQCLTQLLKQLTYQEIGSGWDMEQFTLSGFDLNYYPSEADPKTQVNPKMKMTEIYHFCVDYANNFSITSPSLLFLGSTGLGKTHLSLAIAKEALNKGYGAMYTSAQGMVTKLEKEKFRRYADEEQEESYLERVQESDLLILDDLGTEYPTPFSSAAINDIIDCRLVQGLPTIISTNLDGAGIRDRYGARLLSRLLGSYTAFQFFGKDIRAIRRLPSGG